MLHSPPVPTSHPRHSITETPALAAALEPLRRRLGARRPDARESSSCEAPSRSSASSRRRIGRGRGRLRRSWIGSAKRRSRTSTRSAAFATPAAGRERRATAARRQRVLATRQPAARPDPARRGGRIDREGSWQPARRCCSRHGPVETCHRSIRPSCRFFQISERAERRATELQEQLRAAHRHLGVPPLDYLIAAIAEDHGASILHYDADFDRLATSTDLAVTVEALAPLGSLA